MYETIIINLPLILALIWLVIAMMSPKTTSVKHRTILYLFYVTAAILAISVGVMSEARSQTSQIIARVVAVGELSAFLPLYFYNIKIITIPSDKLVTEAAWLTIPIAILLILAILWHNPIFNLIFVGVMALLSVVIIFTNLNEFKKNKHNVVHGIKGQIIVAVLVPVLIITCISLFPIIENQQFLLSSMTSGLCAVAISLVGSKNLQFHLKNKELRQGENANKNSSSNRRGYNKFEKIREASLIENTGGVNTEENMTFLADRIIKLIESNKMYLQQDLRVTDIAIKLSTNRTYVSQAINQRMGYSFSDFVNNYRIEFAIEKLSIPKNSKYTIEAIAEDSGFSNVTSLNRAFKAKLKMTPHQYRQAIIHKMEVEELNRALQEPVPELQPIEVVAEE